jgi:uncharacterized protein (DUF1800 family)
MAPPSAAPKVTFYAASRFAEQATFGPTPALVAEIRAKGFEAWIDDQFALPLEPLDPSVVERLYTLTTQPRPIPTEIWHDLDWQFMRRALSASDQLRWRVMWSLSNYIVVSRSVGATPPGYLHWVNIIYRQSFGSYRDLLREVTKNPFMGVYLNNRENRPKSAECPQCAPNENYARELMQLFSLGVVKLNPDGPPVRTARGGYAETYAQSDVEELARALTGWVFDPDPKARPGANWGNWSKPMVPSTWLPERDSGRKVVLGKVFPEGQSATADLDAITQMLLEHPNIAPFVSLRLIQHLVKSDPSPDYVRRVATVFRNNGRGAVGDLKAVIKAILLDAEARRGDNPAQSLASDGKFREPLLFRAAVFRGLGCREFSANADGSPWIFTAQPIIFAASVFGYYAPTDRAPGSNLLAPEQGLVHARELTDRMAYLNNLRWNPKTGTSELTAFTQGGCRVDEFVEAYARSSVEFLDLVSTRFFRGAMPPTLRSTIEAAMKSPIYFDPSEGALRMLGYALAAPAYGVSK